MSCCLNCVQLYVELFETESVAEAQLPNKGQLLYQMMA